MTDLRPGPGGEPGSHRRRPTVVVAGAGAAGSLTALHLLRTATSRSTGLDVVLLDPAPRWARGVAFGTSDPRHLLNVPASGMSALPEDPAHFVSWRARQEHAAPDPGAFASRCQFAHYLDQTLTAEAASTDGLVSLHHERDRAVAVRRGPERTCVRTGAGREVSADAVVVATGLPQVGHDWAPEDLRASERFVGDPWAPGVLDLVRGDRTGPPDVLVVGTGLTMVDVVLSLCGPAERADRRLHAVSRHGRLPRPHTAMGKTAAVPDLATWGHTLPELRSEVARHLTDVARATGDWRPAMDGLRTVATTLWQRLDEAERAEFLARDAGAWNVARHRMAPSSGVALRALRSGRRLGVAAARVVGAEPLRAGGLRVRLSDGTCRDVGWVVNCTGPRTDIRELGNPLLDDLLRPQDGPALAVVATAGMGLRTEQGRLVDGSGRADAPVWTLGALRRGELWESTAVPEIRTQALALAGAVLDAVAPRTGPVDAAS